MLYVNPFITFNSYQRLNIVHYQAKCISGETFDFTLRVQKRHAVTCCVALFLFMQFPIIDSLCKSIYCMIVT